MHVKYYKHEYYVLRESKLDQIDRQNAFLIYLFEIQATVYSSDDRCLINPFQLEL